MADLRFEDKVEAVHEALRAAEVPHAIGGALALAFYGEPRATKDIDVNVFIPVEHRSVVVAAFAKLGIVTTDRADPDRDGWEQFKWGQIPVDVYYAYDPFHEAMQRDARDLPYGEPLLPFLSPEHLAACKAIFDRPKDWLDLDQMLFALDEFDSAEALHWVEHVVGSDDERYRRFADAIERLRG
ncbi:MAG: hypothetical protein ACRD0G_18110 [Acidimicrobiales bacterium]